MPTLAADIPVSQAELRLLQTLIYQECGMFFDERRMQFLQERLQQRLKTANSILFTAITCCLRSRRASTSYRAARTSQRDRNQFFPDPSAARNFQEASAGRSIEAEAERPRLLPAHLERRLLHRAGALHAGHSHLRRAGVLRFAQPAALPEMPTPKPLIPPPWNVEILASDINYSALLAAQQGIYTEAQMETVDYHLPRLRYFDKAGDRYVVKPELKNFVQFDFHNLKTEFLPRRNDVIFCRNVMIYFDAAEQRRLIDKFHHCLNPEGYLFVGHAESLFGLTDKFRA